MPPSLRMAFTAAALPSMTSMFRVECRSKLASDDSTTRPRRRGVTQRCRERETVSSSVNNKSICIYHLATLAAHSWRHSLRRRRCAAHTIHPGLTNDKQLRGGAAGALLAVPDSRMTRHGMPHYGTLHGRAVVARWTADLISGRSSLTASPPVEGDVSLCSFAKSLKPSE